MSVNTRSVQKWLDDGALANPPYSDIRALLGENERLLDELNYMKSLYGTTHVCELDQVEFESLPNVLRRRHATLREEYNEKFLFPILRAAAELEKYRAALEQKP